MITKDLRDRFRFFLAHAGYATPPGRAQCALDLARVEQWADSADLVYEETEDDRAYCYCDDPACKYHEGSDHDWSTIAIVLYRPCPDHGTRCRHAEVLASLYGIMDPDDAYRRVVRAELASEVCPAPDTIDGFTRAYLECALWTEDPDPGSGEWSEHDDWTIENIDRASFLRAVEVCQDFQAGNRNDLERAYAARPDYDETRAGHDFWLTRNGHGAGFWDRGLDGAGTRLTEACRPYGEAYCYQADDGTIAIDD